MYAYTYARAGGTSGRDKEISTSDYNPLSVAWDSVTATRADARDERPGHSFVHESATMNNTYSMDVRDDVFTFEMVS